MKNFQKIKVILCYYDKWLNNKLWYRGVVNEESKGFH